MSGQQIGTAVGFVVGAYFGMPQLGAAIGGMIGGAIDPTEIEGPHIGDGRQQSSEEGAPIAWVLGTYGWIQGNIVQKSDRREVKKEDDGKGSGTVAITYEAHQDYCIMVCESSETRDSTVVGPLIVKVNGKIVYDMRPGKSFGAENAKFLANHTFYVGNEDQMPDATMEAITGVGNTPAYRGVFTCVARDINLAPFGDAVPTYEWVMVSEGESVTTIVRDLQTPVLSRFVDGDWPLVDLESDYTFVGSRNSYDFASYSDVNGDTIAEIIAATPNYGSTATKFLGWSLENSDARWMYGRADPVDDQTVVLVFNTELDTAGLLDQNPYGTGSNCTILADDGKWWLGSGGQMFTRIEDGAVYENYQSCTGSTDVGGMEPLIIRATRKVKKPVTPIGDPCLLGVPTALPDTAGFVIDCAGNITPAGEYEVGADLYKALQVAQTVLVGSRLVYTKHPVGPVIISGSSDDNGTFWTAAYDAAVIAGTMAPGLIYGYDYPRTPPLVYEAVYTDSTLTGDPITVASAIGRICVRGGLLAGQVDTVDVTQSLLGYGIANTYNGADCVRPLVTAYGLYAAEYDMQLHFHKLSEDAEIVIDPGEMIAGETQTDQAEREQAIEYPRKILLNYIDLEQDYAVRPQPWQRISPDVRAIGEETMQVAVVMTPDEAAKTVDTYGKRTTARAQGTRKFSLPFAGANEVYLRLHAGKALGLDGKRWVIDKLSLEDGEIAIESSFDRQSAYTSNVTAIPALPPTPPPASIGGVTLFAAMNLPRLRSMDNVPGMYIAVAGLLDAWTGCVLQMSVDDGASWTTAFSSMTQASVMGYLTAAVDASTGATLSVAVHGGDLNSITETQLANGGNPCAVLTDSVAEILQFQDADELEPGEYDLTTLTRGGLSTLPAPHIVGDRFVKLADYYFLPLDINLAGRTIKFRPVTFGTIPENNANYDVVFLPQFTGPQISNPLTVGGDQITVNGLPIYVVT